MALKAELLENLTQNVYAEIGPSKKVPGEMGVIALRDIPSGEDVFKISNVPVKRPLIKLTEAEVEALPLVARTQVKKFILPDEDKSYSIPTTGLNSLDVSFFVNSASAESGEANCISCDMDDDSRGFNIIKTTRLIREGEELLYVYGKFERCRACGERNALEANIVGCGCSGKRYLCEPCAVQKARL